MSRRLDIGRDGERRAAEWYRANGYTILARNWRVRSGELDLVVGRDGLVVFCEVKTRTSTRFGRGAEAVGHDKRRRIRALAIEWLRAADGHYPDVRFDVVEVDGRGTIEVFEGCF